MKNSLIRHVAIIGTLFLGGCTTANKPAEMSSDGLELVVSKSSTIAYRKEGVDFADYDKLVILPSTVAFRKDWKRNYNQGQSISMKITDEEMLSIREKLATLVDNTFEEEFSKSERYTLLDKPQPGSLFLKPAIINLEINAPDLNKAPMNKRAVRSAGQGTLYLEVFDGVTGDILVRIIDAEKAGSDGRFYRIANKATNNKDARLLAEKWAKALRKVFDQAGENKSEQPQ